MSHDNQQDGYDLLIEAKPDTASGSYQGGGASLLVNASKALEAAGATLAEAAGSFRKKLAATAPDKIELEVRMMLKGESRWLIVTGGEASMVVTMTWKRPTGSQGSV